MIVMAEGRIWRISGPLVIAEGMKGSMVYEVVEVGEERLIGEIIGLEGERAIIQVYEDTTGLTLGEPVRGTGNPLVAELGPGLVGSIFDGIQRPLSELWHRVGDFVTRGVKLNALPRDRKWHFVPREGLDRVGPGDVLGHVEETPLVRHLIMVPPGVSGRLVRLAEEGDYTVEEEIARVEADGREEPITMLQRWPVRSPRPHARKLDPEIPMITGTRIIDYLFPIAKGGKGAIPGGFGTGKTVMQHQLTKWSDTQIKVYVGCGERGNEMADALHEYRRLQDPETGRPLLERSVFIANTSNMPVAARETSVFLGVTIGEYYRDMGYHALVVADSTSRWAEAMREISGRLEEMPGEEGFPAYLGSRLAEFYERAGRVVCQGSPEREGSLTITGAVSPPGADFSEPVTQNTLRYVRTLWALDVNLANQRHFPAISWLTSYSLYSEIVSGWWAENVGPEFPEFRAEAMRILQEEAELSEIVRLVGMEALPERDKLTLEIARMIREDFLRQNAFSEFDSYSPPRKTHLLMKLIMAFYRRAKELVEEGVPVSEIVKLPVRYRIARAKETDFREFDALYEELMREMEEEFSRLGGGS